MSFTRLVDTVLNAPTKRPNGLRCAGTNGESTEPVVEAVRGRAVRELP